MNLKAIWQYPVKSCDGIALWVYRKMDQGFALGIAFGSYFKPCNEVVVRIGDAVSVMKTGRSLVFIGSFGA